MVNEWQVAIAVNSNGSSRLECSLFSRMLDAVMTSGSVEGSYEDKLYSNEYVNTNQRRNITCGWSKHLRFVSNFCNWNNSP